MTIKNLPTIVGTEKLRIYRGNKVEIETWINGASIRGFMAENSVLRQYANEEVDYIEICIEGCLSEILVMEIYLK